MALAYRNSLDMGENAKKEREKRRKEERKKGGIMDGVIEDR